MKFILVALILCTTVYVVCGEKLLASSSRQLNRRETKLVKRLVKRQVLSGKKKEKKRCVWFFFIVFCQWLDPNCDRRTCNVPNCGKDFVAAALPGECCEKCVPWEYAASLGIKYPQAPPQPQYDPRTQYNYNYPYQQQPAYQQQQQQRVDVYIFGPDDGARVSSGQSIYFDCEVVSPYNQYAQPRWSRSGNQVRELNWIYEILSNCRLIFVYHSHYHTKHKVYHCQVIVNSHDLQFLMQLKVMLADTNVVLVLAIRMM